MIVVSNTSLTNLAAIHQFELLRTLFGQVHIAEGVWNELNAGDLYRYVLEKAGETEDA